MSASIQTESDLPLLIAAIHACLKQEKTRYGGVRPMARALGIKASTVSWWTTEKPKESGMGVQRPKSRRLSEKSIQRLYSARLLPTEVKQLVRELANAIGCKIDDGAHFSVQIKKRVSKTRPAYLDSFCASISSARAASRPLTEGERDVHS
jgi:hypothetical protein